MHQKLTVKEGGVLYKVRKLPTDYQPGYRFFERMGLAISIILFVYVVLLLIMKPVSKHQERLRKMKNLYFIRHEIKKRLEGNTIKMEAVLDTIFKTGDNI